MEGVLQLSAQTTSNIWYIKLINFQPAIQIHLFLSQPSLCHNQCFNHKYFKQDSQTLHVKT